jgi:hypothetical protein
MVDMLQLDDPPWRHEFVLARDLRALGRHSELVHDVRQARLTPVVRGAYRRADAVETDEQRRDDDAYLARIRAAQLLAGQRLVFRAFSAARIWGLPMVGRWPRPVEIVGIHADGGRSNSTLARSYLGYPAPSTERDGLGVTTLARTVVDVARKGGFGQAVAMADAALHGQEPTEHRTERASLSLAELSAELAGLDRAPGTAKARGVLGFADGSAESPGESISRAGMHLLGLPPPITQVAFVDSLGLIGIVDFWWPEFGLIGEFDGVGKYLRDEFTAERSPAAIVMEEKRREDRLRALGHTVTRWGWSTALSLPLLRAQLTAAMR